MMREPSRVPTKTEIAVILVDVCTAEVAVLAVQKEAAVRGPFEPAKAEGGLKPIALAASNAERSDDAVKRGRFGAPERRLLDWCRGLLRGGACAGREIEAARRQGRDRSAAGIDHASLNSDLSR